MDIISKPSPDVEGIKGRDLHKIVNIILRPEDQNKFYIFDSITYCYIRKPDYKGGKLVIDGANITSLNEGLNRHFIFNHALYDLLTYCKAVAFKVVCATIYQNLKNEGYEHDLIVGIIRELMCNDDEEDCCFSTIDAGTKIKSLLCPERLVIVEPGTVIIYKIKVCEGYIYEDDD